MTCDCCDYAFAGTANITFVLSSNDDRDKGIKYFCRVNCLLDYVEMQYGATDHIPDVGNMVEPTPEKCSEVGVQECTVCRTKISEENFYCDSCDEYFKHNPKPKKLKPVDENCLYKPILTAKGSAIYVGKNTQDEYMVNRVNFVLKGGNVVRYLDYDYGDGGNYE